MNSIKNSVQLIGHLGKDVDVKTLENGNARALVSLATNEYYKNNNGEKVQNTYWHNIVAWGKTAESMSSHLQKGNEVLIRGKLVHRSYEDDSGTKRYVSEVVANEFMKLTKKEEADMPF